MTAPTHLDTDRVRLWTVTQTYRCQVIAPSPSAAYRAAATAEIGRDITAHAHLQDVGTVTPTTLLHHLRAGEHRTVPYALPGLDVPRMSNAEWVDLIAARPPSEADLERAGQVTLLEGL
jgi:hypothetical protein